MKAELADMGKLAKAGRRSCSELGGFRAGRNGFYTVAGNPRSRSREQTIKDALAGKCGYQSPWAKAELERELATIQAGFAS